MQTSHLNFKTIFTLLFLQILAICSAQTAATNLKINSTNTYNIKVDHISDVYNIVISDDDGTELKSLTRTRFTSGELRDIINGVITRLSLTLTTSEAQALSININIAFLDLYTNLEANDSQGQQIATIILSGKALLLEVDSTTTTIITSREKNIRTSMKSDQTELELVITNAYIVFEDGFIRDLIVHGNVGNIPYTFSNFYPIGITTRANIVSLSKTFLFNEHSGENMRLRVSDVIKYNRTPNLRTSDYSPANQMINIEAQQAQVVYKTPYSQLFELHIFSDFIGLNENNPNGLVQVELSKRINLNTRRFSLFSKIPSIAWGLFTHMNFEANVSKIEENNRKMPIGQYLSPSDSSRKEFINPLQTLRYSTASVGTNLSLLDLHGASVYVTLNPYFNFYITNLDSSSVSDQNSQYFGESINSLNAGAKIAFLFTPESRWSYKISYDFGCLTNFQNRFDYGVIKNGNLLRSSKAIHSVSLLVALNTGEDGKLFARYGLTGENKHFSENNYSQFQIGYSIYLKARKKS